MSGIDMTEEARGKCKPIFYVTFNLDFVIF